MNCGAGLAMLSLTTASKASNLSSRSIEKIETVPTLATTRMPIDHDKSQQIAGSAWHRNARIGLRGIVIVELELELELLPPGGGMEYFFSIDHTNT
jgi:hypothetical protein